MSTDAEQQQSLDAIRKRILKSEREKKQRKNANRKRTRPKFSKSRSFNGYTMSNKERNAYSRNMNVHIVETEEETDTIIQRLKYTDCVGFDCEGIITLGRTGKLSLIQICDEEHIYLFDILKMNYKIPESLKQWLSSDHCSKFIHDSRQDQDALYHCHNIELGGIFDTTIADLVKRVWLSKAGRIDRLKGMDSLANMIIHNARDYKIIFSIQKQKTGKFITLNDLKQTNNEQDDKKNQPQQQQQQQDVDNDKSWKKIKVNCFDQKQNTKQMMRTDAYLWAKRPIPINLVIYAAVDGYVSLLMGQYFRKKLKQWMIDKTLFVSAKWCRMVAKQIKPRSSSAKVPSSIVKLIRSDTASMNIRNIPPIDQKFRYKREREAAKLREKEEMERKNDDDLNGVDLEFDNLLLMSARHEFIARKLENKMNPNEKCHEQGIMEYVTDIYKLNYDADDPESYVRVGKLNYNRLIPLKLLNAEKGNF